MIWLKRLLYLIGGLFALIVLAIATVYAITAVRFSKHYDVPATLVKLPTDSAALARGKHLTGPIGKCDACHGEDLAGRVLGNNFSFGRLASANLTTGKGGVFRRYDDATVARAIRHGIRGDGTPLIFMPSEAFTPMSDEDVAALIAYLRSLPPVDHEMPAPRVGPVARILSLLTSFPLVPARSIDHTLVPPKSQPEEPSPVYGKYLVELGGCTGCHGPGLNGQAMGPGAKPSTNLTPKAIGDWTEAGFVAVLRTGVRPNHTSIDSTAMPWPQVGKMTDAEIHAVWLYLRSIPPKEFGVK
jgi:mono/diheme cytochrome c family protein